MRFRSSRLCSSSRLDFRGSTWVCTIPRTCSLVGRLAFPGRSGSNPCSSPRARSLTDLNRDAIARIGRGHVLEALFAEQAAELLHRVRITVNEHHARDRTALFDFACVIDQVFLIGVRAKTIEYHDFGRERLDDTEDLHFLAPFYQAPPERVRGLVANDQNGVFRIA